MTKYSLEARNGATIVVDAKGMAVGYVTALVTKNGSVYSLTDNNGGDVATKSAQNAQIFSLNGNLRAHAHSQGGEIVTSSIQSLSVSGFESQDPFQIKANEVSASTHVVLKTSLGQDVSVHGSFAVQHLNLAAIDAEAERQARVASQGINVSVRDLRMGDFPVLGAK
jgi:hypothetical protein